MKKALYLIIFFFINSTNFINSAEVEQKEIQEKQSNENLFDVINPIDYETFINFNIISYINLFLNNAVQLGELFKNPISADQTQIGKIFEDQKNILNAIKYALSSKDQNVSTNLVNLLKSFDKFDMTKIEAQVQHLKLLREYYFEYYINNPIQTLYYLNEFIDEFEHFNLIYDFIIEKTAREYQLDPIIKTINEILDIIITTDNTLQQTNFHNEKINNLLTEIYAFYEQFQEFKAAFEKSKKENEKREIRKKIYLLLNKFFSKFAINDLKQEIINLYHQYYIRFNTFTPTESLLIPNFKKMPQLAFPENEQEINVQSLANILVDDLKLLIENANLEQNMQQKSYLILAQAIDSKLSNIEDKILSEKIAELSQNEKLKILLNKLFDKMKNKEHLLPNVYYQIYNLLTEDIKDANQLSQPTKFLKVNIQNEEEPGEIRFID